MQMLREIEADHVATHSHERVGELLFQQRNDNFSRADISEGPSIENNASLEGDVNGSENDYGQSSPDAAGYRSGQDDPNNLNCDHSSDMGEVERGRVRQIFRGWMNSGVMNQRSSVSRVNNGSTDELLGETEQERVRITRELVQTNGRQVGACPDDIEELVAEVGGPIERVIDGLNANLNEGRHDHFRRGIRRLCGRQALVDMLKQSQRERQRELQSLLEHHAVSRFAHRNRIQALFRGRFLRNNRMNDSERVASVAACELGLLRQRQTVSDLRDGFLSRLDHSSRQLSGSLSDTSSNIGTSGNTIEQNIIINTEDAIDDINSQFDSHNEETESSGLSNDITSIEDDRLAERSSHETSISIFDWRDFNAEEQVRNWQEDSDNESSQENLRNEAVGNPHFEQASEAYQSQLNEEDSYGLMLSDHTESLEGRTTEDSNYLEHSVPLEQGHDQTVETVGNLYNLSEQRGGVGDVVDGYEQETSAGGLSQDLLGNDDVEHDHMHEESEVPREDSGYQENWLEGPSDQASRIARVDTFYLPDDGNIHSTEMRELLTRRSVSTLLRSGFRESLDRLLQSYVERQSHVPFVREGNSPTHSSAAGDTEFRSGNVNEMRANAISSTPPPVPVPPHQVPPVQRLWDEEPHQYHWPQHDMHQRLGIDWDINNDLRYDMARLQQRMNNMQRMLESCMDMQIELQRSIKQEVSAALNRSAGSTGICQTNLLDDGSKWDNVRKGICCICCDSSIDSLLYRCGHMCTCSRCATNLVQHREKCPMCRAPVVEVIRAYCIL